jgi:hypothetical protein
MSQADGSLHADDEAFARFSFDCTAAPRHRVTVSLTDIATGEPIGDAVVRFGPFRQTTGPDGRADFRLPGGDFNCIVIKTNHEAAPQSVSIDRDLALSLPVTVHPERDPYERYWKS